MKTIYIWGCSDDLAEITGDLKDEYYVNDSFSVVFSDGSIVNACYDNDGFWRLSSSECKLDATHYEAGSDFAIDVTNGRDYTDVICVQGDFDWVTVSSHITMVEQ